jgi:hypothetical protein
MKLIITETQYERLKKGETCPHEIEFEVYKPIEYRWKKRKRCISYEFYKLINEHYKHSFNEERPEIDERLRELINDYYYETYYYYPEEFTIRSITPWRISISYKPNYD